jgi:hypothetical protein
LWQEKASRYLHRKGQLYRYLGTDLLRPCEREKQKRNRKKKKQEQEEPRGASIGYHRVPNPQKPQLSPASAIAKTRKRTSALNAATAG